MAHSVVPCETFRQQRLALEQTTAILISRYVDVFVAGFYVINVSRKKARVHVEPVDHSLIR